MIQIVSFDKNENENEEDWGVPPSPRTSENRKKAKRVQLIITLIAFVGISLPAILYWAVHE